MKKEFCTKMTKDLLHNKEVRKYLEKNIVEAIDAGLGPVLFKDLDMILIIIDYPDIAVPKEDLNNIFKIWCSCCLFQTGDKRNLEIAKKFLAKGADYTPDCEEALIKGKKFFLAISLADKNKVDNCLRLIGEADSEDWIGKNLELIQRLGGDLQVCLEIMAPANVMRYAGKFRDYGLDLDWQTYANKNISGGGIDIECLEALILVGVDMFELLAKTDDEYLKVLLFGEEKSKKIWLLMAIKNVALATKYYLDYIDFLDFKSPSSKRKIADWLEWMMSEILGKQPEKIFEILKVFAEVRDMDIFFLCYSQVETFCHLKHLIPWDVDLWQKIPEIVTVK